jgi:protein-S-isoprenylcysteine O-methyltransferase Ste14
MDEAFGQIELWPHRMTFHLAANGRFRPIAVIKRLPDKLAVNGETILVLGGAAVAIFGAVSVLFQADASRSLTEKLVRVVGRLAFVAGTIGWLMMWFTEEAIWSSAPRTCTALASIELKGQVYRNCSYLVHRYQAGEWLFYAGLAAFAVSIALDRLSKRQA